MTSHYSMIILGKGEGVGEVLEVHTAAQHDHTDN